MARTAAAALDRFLELLRAPDNGIQAQLAGIASRDGVALRQVPERSLLLINAPPEVMDQSRDSAYPELCVFAEEAENNGKQKFASFAGTLRLSADVRISSESTEGMESNLHRYVEAVTNVLDAHFGEWEPGLVNPGRYTVKYSPIKVGGNNFLQTARVSFELDLFV